MFLKNGTLQLSKKFLINSCSNIGDYEKTFKNNPISWIIVHNYLNN